MNTRRINDSLANRRRHPFVRVGSSSKMDGDTMKFFEVDEYGNNRMGVDYKSVIDILRDARTAQEKEKKAMDGRWKVIDDKWMDWMDEK